MAVVEGTGGWTGLDGSPLGGLHQPKCPNAEFGPLEGSRGPNPGWWSGAESNCRHRDFQVRGTPETWRNTPLMGSSGRGETSALVTTCHDCHAPSLTGPACGRTLPPGVADCVAVRRLHARVTPLPRPRLLPCERVGALPSGGRDGARPVRLAAVFRRGVWVAGGREVRWREGQVSGSVASGR
jgi:hypothetical protein